MYKVYSQRLFTEDNMEYVSFGIICTDNSNKIPDISLDEEKITAFVHLLNENDLKPVHLEDVVEDFLNELI